jgi:hypothetical protein
MNFILNIDQVDNTNIQYLETKKNIIMNGNFTKIIYSDQYLSLNGLFINFPVEIKRIFENKYNSPSKTIISKHNKAFFNQIIDLECKILEHYNITNNIKKPFSCILSSQLLNGNIKIYRDKKTSFSSPSYILTKNYYYVLPITITENTRTGSTGATGDTLKDIALKISGIWETQFEIGLTYKFIELHNHFHTSGKSSSGF